MAKALICKGAGDWQRVLELCDLDLPERPAPGIARVRMLAAAIHPSDFGMIAGSYGKARIFPCVMGREGVGEVVEGPGQGDIVRIPEELGVWADLIDCPTQSLVKCPKDIAPEQLALSFINPPTALRILENFIALEPGDVVVTNAGKSAVSQALIWLAKDRGLKVHAVIRNQTPEDEAWLKGLGAEAVWDETQAYFKEIKAALALNQVGGESVLKLIKALRDNGICVTIGGAAKEAVRYPTRELIFKNVQLKGFWLDKWMRENPAGGKEMMAQIWDLMRSGKLRQEIAGRYTLEQYREAFAKAGEARRGKVVLVR